MSPKKKFSPTDHIRKPVAPPTQPHKSEVKYRRRKKHKKKEETHD